jgi:predicted MPP superfamily phosphohydrolase
MRDEFSRQNLKKQVYFTKFNGAKKEFRDNILGITLEFGIFFLTILWVFAYLVIPQFSQIVFVSVLIPLFALSILFFYLVFIKFYSIKINKYEFKVPKLKNSVSFVFISDMHIGEERFSSNKKRTKIIVDKINSLNPELVILGGDFVNMEYSINTLELLKGIKAKYKIGVYGNHDSLYLENKQQDEFPQEGVNIIESLDIDLLNNESRVININGENIIFGGITDLMSLNFNIKKAFKETNPELPKILIAHSPDVVDFIEEKDSIDLILSGHTHGGQIVLPLLGPIYKLPVFNTQYRIGSFKIFKNTTLFVSQGSGHSGTRIRFGTSSEICQITLNP